MLDYLSASQAAPEVHEYLTHRGLTPDANTVGVALRALGHPVSPGVVLSVLADLRRATDTYAPRS